MSQALLILLCILIYCSIGAAFLLAYILAMKPQAGETELGLMVLFWPVYALADVVMTIARGLGAFARKRAEAARLVEQREV